MSIGNLYRGKREDNGEWVYGDLIHRKMQSSNGMG